ncbi:HEPN domain-containing protein [Stenotrophomonas geniculata]|jgi:hypothetical protein|uniref:HEPN domain-containing protein n=1 Tax=Stenotrophomonas geniculata TaxID=86188 RepID=UPI002478F47F|nr:HEPN domain-containing protein [Stenotrophomonas geniculata]MDH7551482.1 HEPN domain-containing protein [Stenotrophomonas geniculata]
MPAEDIFQRYEKLLRALVLIARESQGRVIKEDVDVLFSENVNFFVKSYLISACTYLEAFLQDVAFEVSKKICSRVNSAQIPHNFLHWKNPKKDFKDKDLKFALAKFTATRKEISDDISANPYRTIKLFQMLGVDLSCESDFVKNKDFVNSVVTKRNNIVHHNDDASDVSFSDIEHYVDVFSIYMLAIQNACYK